MKILIIEDEEKVVAFLKKGLEEPDHQVISAPDAKTAIGRYKKNRSTSCRLTSFCPT